jgi:hypothetical protein
MSAGSINTIGSDNTLIGSNTDTSVNNLTFTAALGAGAVVSSSNTIALGRSSGQDAVQIPGSLTVSGILTANVNLADGSITTPKLADGSVTRAKKAPGFFETSIEVVNGVTPASSISSQLVECPAARPRVVGGGFTIPDSLAQFVTVLESRPLLGGVGWQVRVRNGGNAMPLGYQVWAVCAN